MIKNYFRIAWRNLRKNRLYTLVNLAGLTIGITSCILIGLYITHEWSYDRFHVNADRIVRVIAGTGRDGKSGQIAVTGTQAGPQFQRSFPAVEAFVRTMFYPSVVANEDKIFTEKAFLFADSSFFHIFSFPLLQGDPSSALKGPKQIVISESMAKKYFGGTSPLGKTLKVNNSTLYTVTGVTRNVPDNSQISFDFVASFSTLTASKTEQWWTANYVTYLLLHNSDQRTALEQQIGSFMRSPEVRSQAGLTGSDYLLFHLEPLKEVHLYSSLDGLQPGGSITYVYMLGAIALLILVIACVNYTNLATAQSEGRKGEISIRKVLGAARGQLFTQYLGESILLTFIALSLATIAAVLLLPVFNQLAGKQLTADYLFRPRPLISLVALGLIISLLAGAYPSFVLSNTRLMSILRSGFRKSASGGALRQTLIVFQFTISVFLMISTIVIFRQLSFIRNKKLGYDKEHIVVIPIDYSAQRNFRALKEAVQRVPGVTSAGGACGKLSFIQWSDKLGAISGNEIQKIDIKAIPADPDFTKTLGMQLVSGSPLTESGFHLMDTSDNYKNFRYNFLLNESAAAALGWTPQQAVGKTVRKNEDGQVMGVVKDFHFTSLHQAITPLVIFLDTSNINELYVRISGKETARTLDQLKAVWKQRLPWRPFQYHFLDEEYEVLYKTETRTGELFGIFSITAILLGCLGLFALAAYTTAQRTREIGIRKVLGASLVQLTGLLSGDFLKLVLVGSVVAFPLAGWAMSKWLDDFAYRTSLPAWIFMTAMGLALLIALVTVSLQTIRAALANPVKALRSE